MDVRKAHKMVSKHEFEHLLTYQKRIEVSKHLILKMMMDKKKKMLNVSLIIYLINTISDSKKLKIYFFLPEILVRFLSS